MSSKLSVSSTQAFDKNRIVPYLKSHNYHIIDLNQQIRRIITQTESEIRSLQITLSELKQTAPIETEKAETLRLHIVSLLESTRDLLRKIDPEDEDLQIVTWRNALLEIHHESDLVRISLSQKITSDASTVNGLVKFYSHVIDINRQFKIMCEEAQRVMSLSVKPVEIHEKSVQTEVSSNFLCSFNKLLFLLLA